MSQRWFTVGGLAVGLFAINVVARLIDRFGYHGSDGKTSIVMFALLAVILAVVAYVRSHDSKPSEWLPSTVGGMSLAMAAAVLIGPFVSGLQPFSNGSAYFFAEVALFAGCGAVGIAVGYWISVVFAHDYRSRALKAYTENRTTKPRKVVRH